MEGVEDVKEGEDEPDEDVDEGGRLEVADVDVGAGVNEDEDGEADNVDIGRGTGDGVYGTADWCCVDVAADCATVEFVRLSGRFDFGSSGHSSVLARIDVARSARRRRSISSSAYL